MHCFVLHGDVHTVPLPKKQTPADRNYIRHADGLATLYDLRHARLVPHELAEIRCQLWLSQALQNVGVGSNFYRTLLSYIQLISLDLRLVVLLPRNWRQR